MTRQRQLLLRQSARLSKGRGREILAIPKLEDANFAGSKKPDKAAAGEEGAPAPPQSRGCTLILTEGDSAKALAVAGPFPVSESFRLSLCPLFE